jgi:hypothetical protein
MRTKCDPTKPYLAIGSELGIDKDSELPVRGCGFKSDTDIVEAKLAKIKDEGYSSRDPLKILFFKPLKKIISTPI